ncbi:folylpolyglutamate synthase, mitochondrial isoform X1 [Diorhabda sublineata]|uniref:folylpolyglutamate synthase, mitochondrial isoform X1 n=1 Tax=Diorhabda sublineata TaxID=1163346 RepID=UPI0024E049C1|nr:folylpolyglutamate synthase, mitochondrial isoform X1 [Diorhabda sublineata]
MKTPCLILSKITRSFSSAIVKLEKNMSEKTYEDALAALNDLQSNAQYIRDAGKSNILKQVANKPEVLTYLQRTGLNVKDLDKLKVVHVTGTNGKGSTCAYTEQILRNHGCKTGFFSSPHLLEVRERIRINGKPISKTEFTHYFWKIHDLLTNNKENFTDMPMYFRFMTILAFHVFLGNKVDVAILEVGIGGEYDCTNIVKKTLVVGITPLDLDHMSLLGDSLESIAWHKAGIMKEGCTALTVPQPPNVFRIFKERSIEKKCTLNVVDCDYYGGNDRIPLNVCKTNASLALALAEAFLNKDENRNFKKFDFDLAKKSIGITYWPGRYEIKPHQNHTFYLDGAHTLDSCRVCRDWFVSHVNNSKKKRCLIFNLTRDRRADVFFRELLTCDFDVAIFIPNVGSYNDKPDTADFLCPADKQLVQCEANKKLWLEMEGNRSKKVEIALVLPSFEKTVEFLNRTGEYDSLVTGSIHLIGAALSILDPNLGGTLKDD